MIEEEFHFSTKPVMPKTTKEILLSLCVIGAPLTGALLFCMALDYLRRERESRGR